MRSVLATCSAALLLGLAGMAQAGDPAVGKAEVEAVCSECHEAAEWGEEDAASLQAKIKNVVAGKVKHKKKLALSDEEIASIAAYWATAGASK
jgi:mono/diheme cytochrome c family protein